MGLGYSAFSRRTLRLTAACAVLAVLAACESSIGGTAAPEPGAAGSTRATSGAATATASSDPGQITVPSGGPAGGASTSSRPSSAPGTPGTSATAGPTAPGTVPSGLATVYGQRLNWGGCTDYATNAADRRYYSQPIFECARLTVPLTYADPTGQTVTVGVLRHRATGDPGQRIGSVVMDPGGPGASGMSFASQLVLAGVSKVVNQRFDFVGFDPRGIGSSEPAVACLTDQQRDAARQVDLRSRTAAEVTAANDVQKAFVAACLANVGTKQGIDSKTFLANVGTRDVARDLDVLRAALGDRKLTYIGFSYGTRIGYIYAEQFPGNVRAMILDGVLAADQDPATDSINQAKGFQGAFDDFATWCSQNQPCVLGTDPGKATAVYQSLVRPLLANKITLSDGRRLSFNDANTGTAAALYSDSQRPALAKALLQLSKGNGNELMALADGYFERDASGHYSNLLEAFNAVRCMDQPRMTDPTQITKLNTQLAAAAPFEDPGDPAGPVADVCSFWPAPPTWLPHKLKIAGLPTLLVISTKGDPATPYQAGVDLAGQLNAALLTVEGTRHTAFLGAGIACADAAGNAYLIDLILPAKGADCQT